MQVCPQSAPTVCFKSLNLYTSAHSDRVLAADDQGCNFLGNTLPQTRSFSSYEAIIEENRLLLDNSPSQTCNGTAVAWNYCFYLVDSNPLFRQRAVFSVYRSFDEERSGVYHRVPESLLIVDVYDEYDTGEFHCVMTPLENTFSIQEGDVIGACLQRSLINPGLDVLEIVSTAHQLSVGAISGDCDNEELNTVNLKDDTWSLTSGVAINAALEIGKYMNASIDQYLCPSSTSPCLQNLTWSL